MEIAETNLVVLHEILEEGMARVAEPAVKVVLKDRHLLGVRVQHHLHEWRMTVCQIPL